MITIEITHGESIKDRLKSRKGKVSTTERGSAERVFRLLRNSAAHPPRGGIDFIPS